MNTHIPARARRTWILLALIVGLSWLGTPPGNASELRWEVIAITQVGCAAGEWQVQLKSTGADGGQYVHHTVVTADGKVYMNEAESKTEADGDPYPWELYATQSGGPTTGTWPVPAGQPFKAVFTLERPAGTVLSSWTMVAASCDSATLLYNGPTAADLDEDYLATPADACPSVHAFTANGCPGIDRTLTLTAKRDPRRVVGKLYAAGHTALHAGQPVTIWKVRPGPDRAVAHRTTNSLGRFKTRVGKGRYYATAPALVVPTSGEVSADRSTTTRVR
jgi:hypothetical protein